MIEKLKENEITFKKIIFQCMEKNETTRALLYVMDEGSGEFVLIAYYGYLKLNPNLKVYDFSHPIVELVRQKRTPFFINDISTEPIVEDYYRDHAIYNVQITPIYHKDKIYGFLEERNRAAKQQYDEKTLENSKKIVEEINETLLFFDKKEEKPVEKKKQTDRKEEYLKTIKEIIIRFSSFKKYIPVISDFFVSSAEVFASAVNYDIAFLSIGIGNNSINLVYSKAPISIRGKKALMSSLKDLFPYDYSKGESYSQFFYGKLRGDEIRDVPKTFYTVKIADKRTLRVHLCLLRNSSVYFDAEELVHISNYNKMLTSYFERLFRDYRCNETFIGLILNLLELSKKKSEVFERHSLNTAKYARLIAEKVSDDMDFIDSVTIAALLHDIGILLIDSNLYEKLYLTEEDVEKIRQHTLVCMKFLSKIRMPEEVKDMIKYHHERYDGFGYPEGLKGEEIPLGARVIAVAEAFETMTGEDSYKETLSLKEAIEELRKNAGDQFDPELVVALESVVKERMNKENGKDSGKK
ncbi:hypothetical protein TTHT_1130 [Thermotomaculum hydrothermale]|uniref:HD-GYP domain-containing protein n=1 Tax=Thermotomaculum hydrothermale TaxID=981385 RepID=A0A7R6PHG0_9BACT|nr:HD domain-containing phosphohydrolase [Thermotomaculum hydrothermale]BBB32664.1 hypothetical protein TTHT_1130 [Thermotomaculum hydrothermale]